MDSRRGSSTGPRSLYAGISLCIMLVLLVDSSQAGRNLQQAPARQTRRLQAYTDSTCTAMHGPALKSFLVSDGSWVDCVRIEEQIAGHHPALKDHVIQMPPSPHSQYNVEFGNAEPCPQSFAREHGGCPEGSIPVLRRDPTLPLLRKQQGPRFMGSPLDTIQAAAADAPHEYAIVEMDPSPGTYGGAGSIFSVNGPFIQDPSSEFSLSQLWVVAGQYNDSSLNTAEVGWQTYPNQHQNDSPGAPHLFVYWTADAYKSTGCYNLGCPGFVQISNTWVLGGAMPNYTTLAANAAYEAEVAILVLYDSSSQAWWLHINNERIGYWPSSLYTTLQSAADVVQWGGEVAPSSASVGHTTTAMGSGAFPSDGYPRAAYQRNVVYGDLASATYDASGLAPIVTDPNCYDNSIQQGNITGWGNYFFFGGPGGANPACLKH